MYHFINVKSPKDKTVMNEKIYILLKTYEFYFKNNSFRP